MSKDEDGETSVVGKGHAETMLKTPTMDLGWNWKCRALLTWTTTLMLEMNKSRDEESPWRMSVERELDAPSGGCE